MEKKQQQQQLILKQRYELAIIGVWLEKLEEAGWSEKKVRKQSDIRNGLIQSGTNEETMKFKEATVNLIDAQKQACKFERGLLSLELMR